MGNNFEDMAKRILAEAPPLPPPQEERVHRHANLNRELPPELEVLPLEDEVVERFGFAPCSQYVEMAWLPVLGPTATLLYRRLGMWVIQNPEGLTVDTTDLAVSLGLGESLSKNSMLAKGVGRLAAFGAAQWQGDDLAVRRALAPVPEHVIRRQSLSAFRAHQEMVEQRRAR